MKVTSDDMSWAWPRNVRLKCETDSFIIATGDQCSQINYFKVRIDKTLENSLCCMCGQKEETVMNRSCDCVKLAQKE